MKTKRDGSQAASGLCYPPGGRQSGGGTANTVMAAHTRLLGKRASHSYCIISHKRSPHRCKRCERAKSGVQVIFLHGGSASTDGTEQDDEFHESQEDKKTERGVLAGEQQQA